MQPPESPLPPHPHQRERYAVPVPVFIGVMLVVMLVFICGLGAIGAIPSIRGLKSPTATATSVQHIPSAATLGGTLGDFTQQYGNSIDEGGQMFAATLAGQRVLIVVQVDNPRQSQDGQGHVIEIDVQVPGDALGVETWDAATADVIAHTFLPADAQFQRTVTAHGVTDSFYHSNMLAATILPGQYTNNPGSLNYSCHPWPPAVTPAASGNGDSHGGVYGQCHIGIGSE